MNNEKVNGRVGIECLECGATETQLGLPLVNISGAHLTSHGMRAVNYLQKYPDAKLFSTSFRENISKAAKQSQPLEHTDSMGDKSNRKWEEIFDIFHDDKYYTVGDLMSTLGVSRQAILQAVYFDRLRADAWVLVESRDPRKLGKDFLLFSEETVLDYFNRKKKRS